MLRMPLVCPRAFVAPHLPPRRRCLICLDYLFSVQLLVDSDTLASRKISTGAAIHLFQRPKSATPAGGAGVGTALAQQPGRLNEIPPLLLHVREAIDGGGGPTPAEGYLDTNWEVEVPRRSIRFLASSLLLLSAMQV